MVVQTRFFSCRFSISHRPDQEIPMVRYFWSTNPIVLRDLARRREDALGADLCAPVCGNRSPSTRGHASQPGLRAVARDQMRPNSP